MSFGIVFKTNAGEIEYISSTRGGASVSDNVKDIASFAQEKNAVNAIRKLRLNGFERLNDGELFVAPIVIAVGPLVDVPHPGAKQGFTIQRAQDGLYYNGPRTAIPGWKCIYAWGEIEAATAFKFHDQAFERVEFIKQALKTMAVEEMEEKPSQTTYQDMYYRYKDMTVVQL